MQILVCGGAGFMGSHFIKYILEKYPDYMLVNFDKLTYAGNLENLKEVENNKRYKFVKGDICDASEVDRVVRENKIDTIVNYAAETHVDRSVMDPSAFLKTNIFGSYNLLEATKKFDLKKMVQVSTDEVFGSIDSGKFREDSPFEPNSPYSAAKAGGDLLCRSYFVTFQTPVVVTHSCNFYGSNQYPEKLIPLFVTNLLEGKKVPVYGDGKQVREWIYTEDHCNAIDVILHKAKAGSVYNIGSGDEIENIEITKLILEYLGYDEKMIEYVKDRPGHDKRYALDANKLKNELGWEAKVNFRDGLKKTVDWYRENEDWWKKIKDGSYLEYYKKQYN
ncbi:MAG: dTDP-glucose 4,6-dehydratase [Candidatus Magasanikbacteria bacterium RIFCSPHIGHO2_01_FULL_33_34]|uniref:dTDP-glucose 4,6-dehydratase n=1 Tax=Candidatus Magasanikbacteria bacterium RIFCSPHIGHO2_01_FULL_33_34 TaxID=1798671 RepID=A0A1F6LKY4_9BACT|nr:MAG: dTDP-glucose 4,6-dehydratase [Candidatus Magasanikbacteria bacterium RIFCSPHIGHO2_01_FULL_33_34]OGH65785.1 MAG: dTDP-glucose 4,6-dehydratase [Candidatus Magasanikbacteria bacterium RIFCSPHIGHO2_02_FULL_33_17]OGH75150.1 MAG: dTDP-glucose 4,6-dehydratase [Candidatus Magasanikbacteria bacterium RIFCSPLOWO2_01_FULL_33_34]